MFKLCKLCGIAFDPVRSDQDYCDQACRQAAYRDRSRSRKPPHRRRNRRRRQSDPRPETETRRDGVTAETADPSETLDPGLRSPTGSDAVTASHPHADAAPTPSHDLSPQRHEAV